MVVQLFRVSGANNIMVVVACEIVDNNLTYSYQKQRFDSLQNMKFSFIRKRLSKSYNLVIDWMDKWIYVICSHIGVLKLVNQRIFDIKNTEKRLSINFVIERCILINSQVNKNPE